MTASLGEAIAQDGGLYTIKAIGLASQNGDRVWLVADATVAQTRCRGSLSVWEFLFVAADGAIYQPTPQGRRGEFTSYDIPAGRWAGGRLFFDLPVAAVRGGAVGFRKPPFATSYQYPEPTQPYGLWPVRWPLPEAGGPNDYPAA